MLIQIKSSLLSACAVSTVLCGLISALFNAAYGNGFHDVSRCDFSLISDFVNSNEFKFAFRLCCSFSIVLCGLISAPFNAAYGNEFHDVSRCDFILSGV